MKKKASIILICALVLLSAPDASACGDKLLHLSRIHRLKFANTSIVVFSRPKSILESLEHLRLTKDFQDAGYRFALVNNDRDLEIAIQSGKVGVLILDMMDAPLVQSMNPPASLLLVPVITKETRRIEADIKAYPAVIKTPAKSGKFVDAVDRALYAQWTRQKSKTPQQSLFAR
jgi:hypothetical protein